MSPTKPSRSSARRIALARLVSLTGSQAAFTALVFALFDRTGSSRWVSAGLLVTFGTQGVLTPVAGFLGDRFDRRGVMIGSDLLAAASFTALSFAHEPGPLLALAFLAAVVESPFFPAAGGAVPNLVAQDDLVWANSTIALGSNVGYLVGPALGGVLVAAFGSTLVFQLNAMTFVASAALVATVRSAFSGRRPGETRQSGMRAGVRHILRQPTLRTLALAFAIFAVSVGSVLVAELPLAESFGAGAVGYGLLSTCFGIGALGGSVAARSLTERTERRALVIGSLVTAVGFGSVVLSPAFWLVLAGMLVGGASDGMVDVAVEVMFQRLTPDAVRSRALGAMEAVFLLGLAVSFLFGGWLVDALGPKAAYGLAGAGCAATAVMLLPLLWTSLPVEGDTGP